MGIVRVFGCVRVWLIRVGGIGWKCLRCWLHNVFVLFLLVLVDLGSGRGLASWLRVLSHGR